MDEVLSYARRQRRDRLLWMVGNGRAKPDSSLARKEKTPVFGDVRTVIVHMSKNMALGTFPSELMDGVLPYARLQRRDQLLRMVGNGQAKLDNVLERKNLH